MTLQEKRIVEVEVLKLDLKAKKVKVQLLKALVEMLTSIRGFFGRIQGKYRWFEYVWRVTVLAFVILVVIVLVRR